MASSTPAAYAATNAFALREWYIRNTGQAVAPQGKPGVEGIDYNVLPVWQQGDTGQGVVVAVLDDGVQASQPAFAGSLNAALSYDYVSGVADPSGNAAVPDNDGNPTDAHGTNVAGVALGNASWGGPVGVAPGATLAAGRVQIGVTPVPGSPNAGSNRGGTLAETLLPALALATKSADVDNNSFGGDAALTSDQYGGKTGAGTVPDAIVQAAATGRGGLGLNIVYAAGNEGDQGADVAFQNESADPHVITVGSLNRDGTPTLSFTHGAGLLVAGPGTEMLTANPVLPGAATAADGLPAGATTVTGGTSFSAPGVSGVVALMLQANPLLGWRDVQEILVDSARIPGVNGVSKPDGTPWFTMTGGSDWNGGGRHFSNAYGYGLPDALTAVQLARTWTATSTSANLKTASVAAAPGTVVTGGAAPASLTVSYAQDLRVQHVQVTLDAPSLQSNDLTATLIAPDGTRSTLFDRPGTDQSLATLPPGVLPAAQLLDKDGTGRTNPDGSPLLNSAPMDFLLTDNAFWGVNARGTWTMQITDVKTGETGTVDAFSMTFYGDGAASAGTLVYTPEFATLAAQAPSRTMVTPGGARAINLAAMAGTTVLDLAGGQGSIGGVAVTVQAGLHDAVGGMGDTALIGAADGNSRLEATTGNTLLVARGGGNTLLGETGQDTMIAGSGSTTVLSGSASLIALGVGEALVGSVGQDTIVGGGGSATVGVLGPNGALAFAEAGRLVFVNGNAASTVVGGEGSATVFGEGGSGVFFGGSAGNNLLVAGLGATTLVGGGNGDLLFAAGTGGAVLAAGAGNETLSSGTSTGGNTYIAGGPGTAVLIGAGTGNDTVLAGAGSATVFGGAGADLFAFSAGRGGGATFIADFDQAAGDRITLQGYDASELAGALTRAAASDAGVMTRLSDGTTIAFAGLHGLDRSMFA